MVAWESYLGLHKFAGFPAFHFNHSKPFVCPILLKSGHESLSDTSFGGFIQFSQFSETASSGKFEAFLETFQHCL